MYVRQNRDTIRVLTFRASVRRYDRRQARIGISRSANISDGENDSSSGISSRADINGSINEN